MKRAYLENLRRPARNAGESESDHRLDTSPVHACGEQCLRALMTHESTPGVSTMDGGPAGKFLRLARVRSAEERGESEALASDTVAHEPCDHPRTSGVRVGVVGAQRVKFRPINGL